MSKRKTAKNTQPFSRAQESKCTTKNDISDSWTAKLLKEIKKRSQ